MELKTSHLIISLSLNTTDLKYLRTNEQDICALSYMPCVGLCQMIYRRKDQYIDSIGSENEKLKPEEDKDESSVFDFSYQDFIKNLTTNLESVGISTGETKYLDSVTFITIILPDNSSGTIKVLSNDSQNVSCIIVPIELVSDDILAAITEIIDNTISVAKKDIDSGPYTVNGVLYLSNDRTLSILPDD